MLQVPQRLKVNVRVFVTCINGIQRVIGQKYLIYIILVIIFDMGFSNRIQQIQQITTEFDLGTDFDSVLKDGKFSSNFKPHRHRHKNVSSLNRALDKHIITETITETIKALIESTTLEELRNDSVLLNGLHTSQLGNLIELLQQHSSDIDPNNGSENVIENDVDINRSLDSLNSLGTEAYYDILYDLGLDHNPHHECKFSANTTMSHDLLVLPHYKYKANKRLVLSIYYLTS